MLAVISLKGGVGKTSVTLGLAATAWAAGHRTLVVDLDPQANATTGLDPAPYDFTSNDVLADGRTGIAAEAIVASGWGAGIDLIPGERALEHRAWAESENSALRLRMALHGAVDRYHTILIDCPPSLGELTRNALAAAPAALIVTEPSYFALQGAEQALEAVEVARAATNLGLRTAGIVVNRVRRSTEHAFRVARAAFRVPAAGPGAADPRSHRDDGVPGGRGPHHEPALPRRRRPDRAVRPAGRHHRGVIVMSGIPAPRPALKKAADAHIHPAAPDHRPVLLRHAADSEAEAKAASEPAAATGAPEARLRQGQGPAVHRSGEGQLAVRAVGREHLGQHAPPSRAGDRPAKASGKKVTLTVKIPKSLRKEFNAALKADRKDADAVVTSLLRSWLDG